MTTTVFFALDEIDSIQMFIQCIIYNISYIIASKIYIKLKFHSTRIIKGKELDIKVNELYTDSTTQRRYTSARVADTSEKMHVFFSFLQYLP